MKLLLAKCISFVLNPFLFLILAPYLVVIKETSDQFIALRWEMFSTMFVVIGLFILVLGKKRGVFSDFDLSKREERSKFYLLVWPILILYVFSALFFRGPFFSLSVIAIGIVAGLIIFEIVNTKIKASIHLGVASGFIITVGMLFGPTVFLSLIIILPLLAWSRIVLKRHTVVEVIVGCILGFLIAVATLFLGKYIILHKLW